MILLITYLILLSLRVSNYLKTKLYIRLNLPFLYSPRPPPAAPNSSPGRPAPCISCC